MDDATSLSLSLSFYTFVRVNNEPVFKFYHWEGDRESVYIKVAGETGVSTGRETLWIGEPARREKQQLETHAMGASNGTNGHFFSKRDKEREKRKEEATTQYTARPRDTPKCLIMRIFKCTCRWVPNQYLQLFYETLFLFIVSLSLSLSRSFSFPPALRSLCVDLLTRTQHSTNGMVYSRPYCRERERERDQALGYA